MAAGTRLSGSALKAAPHPTPGPVPKSTAGRLACGECGARLSSYNPGPNCYAHTLDVPWRGPGARPR